MKRTYTLAGTRTTSRFLFVDGKAVGTETGVVAIEVDVDDLARFLGRRALFNKTGTAILGGGAVRARLTSRRQP